MELTTAEIEDLKVTQHNMALEGHMISMEELIASRNERIANRNDERIKETVERAKEERITYLEAFKKYYLKKENSSDE